jgi:hypothetical protein
VTFELGRSILRSGAVTPEALAHALAVTIDPGMPLARALVGLGLLSEEDVQEELARSDLSPALTEVHPRLDLLSTLPSGMCNRLAALPVHVEADGTIVVAVLDPRDAYVAEELCFHLRAAIRLVRAPYSILREALVNYATTVQSSLPAPGLRRERRRAVSYTPAWGTPIEVEVLAEAVHGPRTPSSPVQGPVASVTTSTRRFFAGMHSAPSEPPPGQETEAAPPAVQLPVAHAASPTDHPAAHEPVFELRRGPSQTLPEIEPPTQRTREAPAFPLVASLPAGLPSLRPEAIPAYAPDPASTLSQLRAATTRDEVLALVEKSARSVAVRVALLVVRRDTVVGWSCSPELGDADALKSLSISTRGPSLLGTVLDGGVYLGPLLGSVATALLKVMRTASRDVAIVAVRVAEKPAVLVVCDDLADTLLATRHLDVMAKVAGEALARIVRARNRGASP